MNNNSLTEVQISILRLLQNAPLEMEAIAAEMQLNHSQVMAASLEMQHWGLLTIEEAERYEIVPHENIDNLLDTGLPERRAAVQLEAVGGEMSMTDLSAWSQDKKVAMHELMRWGQARGWFQKVPISSSEKKKLFNVVLTDEGRQAINQKQDDERTLELAQSGKLFLDELADRGIDTQKVRELLINREGVARIKKRAHRTVTINAQGRELLNSGAKATAEKNTLSADDIRSGDWRNISLRRYDVSLPARVVFAAKAHPLRRIIEETRRAFLEMGFTEVVSPMVESAFWNFDALYQPQDHPARDMQDTFYMAEPSLVDLPEDGVVERVSKTHENGWETGSQGWGYKWDPKQARRTVLRTHTTAATVRALAAHPQPPYKVFCVGWTFRNETISFKHLPVFHQVDGIVIDKEANLSTLLGTLSEFYRKMGFQKVKFKPAFYPYTEPSADVVVYMESRKKWIEMGGSGVFRPEVTKPLGCEYPVLAWGLGIERLAMLRLGLNDIRELYRCSLDQMEEIPLCR
jgi:phenylalanyl-tRNA synthetase alpha chain